MDILKTFLEKKRRKEEEEETRKEVNTERRKEISNASRESAAVQKYNQDAARRKLFADVAAKEKVETRKVRLEQVKEILPSYKKLPKKIKSESARAYGGLRKAYNKLPGRTSISKSKKSGSKTGKRGRPTGTFKVRYLPSGKAVKVPTHIYKKMLSAEKTQMRLVAAQKQQYAEGVAMQQDPRFQPGAEEQFLAEQDQAHEMDVARAQAGYPIQVQQQRAPLLQKAQGLGSQFIRGISNIGGVRAQQEQVVDPYGRTMPVRQQPQPQGQGIIREPQVSLFGSKSNILHTPNIFNKPGESELLLPRRKRRI